ncbi:oligopeptide ABC transporter substrate-binding protein [Filobacillus milosensis]|uniref:Oligopeptide ABC transporter substrate-binding protein n=1 Tax=Filobacillus milosensis TaxID=94137 RepID=A0A4Y8IJ95_9BACI|nr:oligopeptide ABC transporter substrate-binding protein [Filobacillus milosensis]TFB19218.1 oligopeptide ABC transporter substrate-binding protein [Filobacillus milosensis]
MSKSLLGKFLFVLMLASMLLIAACNSDEGSDTPDDGGEDNTEDTTDDGSDDGSEDDGESSDDKKEEDTDGLYSIEDFSTSTSNDGELIDGGEITYGLVSDTAFEGTLNWNFYSGNPDAMVIQWFDESLLTYDENYTITSDGAAEYEVNEEESSITFTIRDNVNWHDGEPVTAEDWKFAYEVISHPDYQGPRGSTVGFTLLEGMQDYRDGNADTISGIVVEDEKTITFNYERLTPSLLTGGIWGYPLAKHIFGDMAVADMASSDAVRQNPIGFGPYKVDSITPGESVTYVKNEDYWRGEPNLDKVTLKVISSSTVANALETGEVDLVDSFPVDQFPDNSNMEGIEWLGDIDLAYTYIGFKLGDWNKEESRVNYKPDEMKMGDVELRRAMWYAVDNNAVGEKFYNGLRWAGTTLIAPSHPAYHDDSIEVPTYDPEKAKQILDDAGYKDTDGDGFRETPDGEPLEINFAAMSGGDVAEPLAQYYLQQWQAVGLNVGLLDGRLLEFNTFYDRVGNGGNDDPAVDVYMGAWGVGYDVDPSGLYGPTAMFNFPRYESEENTELLEKGLSDEAFDTEYRQQVYSDWQKLMVEEIPVFPTLYRSVLIPVNERIANYDISVGSGVYLYELGVTSQD